MTGFLHPGWRDSHRAITITLLFLPGRKDGAILKQDPLKDGQAVRAGHCLITIDEKAVEAIEGQSLAAVLVASELWHFRVHPVTGEPRGPYCGMGVCFECEVEVGGQPTVRACMTAVRDGMVVRTGVVATRQETPGG